MTGRAALLCLLPAAAIATFVASPAAAQCRLCSAPSTAREAEEGKGDVHLEVETSLNFDRLILYGSGTGTAVLRPDGSTSSTGTVADMSPRAMVGTVTVHGEPG